MCPLHIHRQNMEAMIKLSSLLYLSKTHTIPGAFFFSTLDDFPRAVVVGLVRGFVEGGSM
jgi:hypothetical protein